MSEDELLQKVIMEMGTWFNPNDILVCDSSTDKYSVIMHLW